MKNKESIALTRLRKDFLECLGEFGKDNKKWIDFLFFASQVDRYKFHEQVCIYLQNSNAVHTETYAQWQEMGCKLKLAAKRISIPDGKQGIYFVYNSEDVIGEFKKTLKFLDGKGIIEKANMLFTDMIFEKLLSDEICKTTPRISSELKEKAVEVSTALIKMRYNINGLTNDVSLKDFNILEIVKIGDAAFTAINKIDGNTIKTIIESEGKNHEKIHNRNRAGLDFWDGGSDWGMELDNLGDSQSTGGKRAIRKTRRDRNEMADIHLRQPLQSVRIGDNGWDIGRTGERSAKQIQEYVSDVQETIFGIELSEVPKPTGARDIREPGNAVRTGNGNSGSNISKSTDREPSSHGRMVSGSNKLISTDTQMERDSGDANGQLHIVENKEDVLIQEDISSFLLEKNNKSDKGAAAVDFTFNDSVEIPAGQKGKYKCNVEAIRLLKTLQQDKRAATSKEQNILASYSGWGGVSEALDENKGSWAKEYEELKDILTQNEFEAARASTLNAHYTSPQIIRGIYGALENFGFEGGSILEPAMATGNFFSSMPKKMRDNSKLYGVELDSITGQIAQNLFQSADIQIKGFEQTSYQDNFFDLIVGNVPFGEYNLSDKKHKALIHDFFFLKALDLVKPGGIVAYVTSTGTLDKQNPAVRKKLAARAELIGAIRLPDNAFMGTANTKVTTDLIFLQKRVEPMTDEPKWVYTGIYSSDSCSNAVINQYFVDNPFNMLGELQMVSSRFGKAVPTLRCANSDSLEEQIGKVTDKMKGKFNTDKALNSSEDISQAVYLKADESVKNFTFTVINNEIFYRENAVLIPCNTTSQKDAERIKLLCDVRKKVREVIAVQTQGDFSEKYFTESLQGLNEAYDTLYSKFGAINLSANMRAFSRDSDVNLLASLENTVISDNGEIKSFEKGDMFFKQTIKAKNRNLSFQNPVDALNVTIAECGYVDLNYLQSICTKAIDKILEDIEPFIFLKPETYGSCEFKKSYYSKEEYLCDNVVEKLEQARQLAKTESLFEKNVIALERVQPPKLSASDINVRLSSHWIDSSYINQFIFELIDIPSYMRGDYNGGIFAKYSKISNDWTIRGKSIYGGIAASKTFGTSRASALNLIELTLNQKTVTIKDAQDDGNGSVKYVYNHEETIAARQKQGLINEKFKEWIFKDSLRRGELVEKYNKLFNSTVPRGYDGSYIELENANPSISLRPHQLNAVSRVRKGDNTLLAHVVGSGKTFTMIAGGMEQLRLGRANKLMYVVPNHLINDFAIDFLRLYPTANVLVTSEKDFKKESRQKFISRIVTSDIDAVVMGHSQFERIAVSPQRKEIEMRTELSDLESSIRSMAYERGQSSSVKQLESKKAKIKEKLKQLLDTSKKDSQIFFEELGVDSIFIDEAHNYKNGAVFSKMQNVGGVSNSNALKASDMLAKCRYINEIGGTVTFATGTPISNAISEMYIMQRYLQESKLKDVGINHFDEWISIFGETASSVELKPEGTGYRTVTKISNYFNVPELMSIFNEVADIQTSDMLDYLPTPGISGGKAVIVACKPSDELLEFMDESVYRAERIRSGVVRPNEDNMLKLTNDARKAGTDMRLYSNQARFDTDGKISKCCENVVKHYRQTNDLKGTQLVFSDIGTPNSNKFNVYDEVKRILSESGIPEAEIAFIHDYDTQEKKQGLFSDMRSGRKRVLIGSTQKCGAGTNIQDKMIALHHIDCPYRPSDIEQREGRILRQGNTFKEVHIYRYVTEKSFDAYLWQLIEKKQRFISQIMSGKSKQRNCEELDEVSLSYAEVKTIATGNPLIKEKTEIETELNRLNILQRQFQKEIYESEDRLKTILPGLKQIQSKRVNNLQKDMEGYEKSEKFEIAIGNEIFTERAKAGERLLELVEGHSATDQTKVLGEFCGFNIGVKITKDTFQNEVLKLLLMKNEEYETTLSGSSVGNIIKIENLFNDIPFEFNKSQARLEELDKQEKQLTNIVKGQFQFNEKLTALSARLVEIDMQIDQAASHTTENFKQIHAGKIESQFEIEI